jgi:hypothetical protein
MTTTEQQQQQLTGFNQYQTYSHHAKIEENSKAEARVTVSIYSNDTDSAKNECLKLYNQLKEALSNKE